MSKFSPARLVFTVWYAVLFGVGSTWIFIGVTHDKPVVVGLGAGFALYCAIGAARGGWYWGPHK